MIVLIIKSFIELYGIHKKRYWIILFTCIFKFSAMVFIIVDIPSGNNYLLASMFTMFYITKIKLVSKSEENSRENDELLPKFHKRKQSHVSLTSILTSSNSKPEKKIAPKKSTEEIIDNPKLDHVLAACNKNQQQILTKNNPEFDRLYTINVPKILQEIFHDYKIRNLFREILDNSGTFSSDLPEILVPKSTFLDLLDPTSL